MNKKEDFEPSLSKIDDYYGKEPCEKKNTIKKITILCLVVVAIISYFKITSIPNDYIKNTDLQGFTAK